MSINQIVESTTSFIKPLASAATNSQKFAQIPRIADTQDVKLPTAPDLQKNIAQKEISDKALQQAVDQLQEFTSKVANNLKIYIDEDTGKTVVKILDSQTQEVIRQFPSEEAISIARTLDKMQGLLFSDKA